MTRVGQLFAALFLAFGLLSRADFGAADALVLRGTTLMSPSNINTALEVGQCVATNTLPSGASDFCFGLLGLLHVGQKMKMQPDDFFSRDFDDGVVKGTEPLLLRCALWIVEYYCAASCVALFGGEGDPSNNQFIVWCCWKKNYLLEAAMYLSCVASALRPFFCHREEEPVNRAERTLGGTLQVLKNGHFLDYILQKEFGASGLRCGDVDFKPVLWTLNALWSLWSAMDCCLVMNGRQIMCGGKRGRGVPPPEDEMCLWCVPNRLNCFYCCGALPYKRSGKEAV